MEPGLLFIPGPVPLPPQVRDELAKPAMPHYGDAWVKAHAETRDMLRYAWSAPDAHVFPIAGPGHAALEAIGYTFLRPGDRIVVVSNGFFGDRTHEVLLTHRVKADLVSSAWGSAPDLAALRTALKTPAKAVVVVHNETSTGVTNSLDPVRCCRSCSQPPRGGRTRAALGSPCDRWGWMAGRPGRARIHAGRAVRGPLKHGGLLHPSSRGRPGTSRAATEGRA